MGCASTRARVARSSLSFVFPQHGERAILRARDDHYLQSFPRLDLSSAKLLHLDGHMGDAALHYAKAAREKGVLVSLDGGAMRPGMMELLEFVDMPSSPWPVPPNAALGIGDAGVSARQKAVASAA